MLVWSSRFGVTSTDRVIPFVWGHSFSESFQQTLESSRAKYSFFWHFSCTELCVCVLPRIARLPWEQRSIGWRQFHWLVEGVQKELIKIHSWGNHCFLLFCSSNSDKFLFVGWSFVDVILSYLYNWSSSVDSGITFIYFLSFQTPDHAVRLQQLACFPETKHPMNVTKNTKEDAIFTWIKTYR